MAQEMSGSDPALAFRFSAWYGERRVLDDVTGDVRAGEVLSLVGLSVTKFGGVEPFT